MGDVGGTNARFAVAHISGGVIRLEEPVTLPAADYVEGKDAVRAFLEGLKPRERPRLAVIAAAGPVTDGVVSFTNNTGWRFDERELEAVCDLKAVRLINDFAAQALAIEHLGARDIRRVGPKGYPNPRATAAILGPGTGLGAAARVEDGQARAILTCEAAHASFAPVDETEIEILRLLMTRFGRVSIERLLSGPGLLNLYEAMAQIRGEPVVCSHPDEVTQRGQAGDPLARAALDRFCAILGSVAGDYALSTGARGGVYISGGIAPAILDVLESSDFRARFEAKGRMSAYLEAVPTFVVTDPHAALTGAASRLPALERGR